MQLTFTDKLYAAETKDKNLVMNIILLIKNLRYFRVQLERRISVIPEFERKFNTLVFINNKVGYCLYWLATLGYVYSKYTLLDVNTTKDDWYNKTVNKGYDSSSNLLSSHALYDSIGGVEKLSKEFIMLYKHSLIRSPLSKKLIRFYFETLSDIKTNLKTVID